MSYTPSPLKRLLHGARRVAAKKWLSKQKAIQIGITGSQGKTNTTRLIAEVLKKSAPIIVTDKNLDTVYNVPITALKVQPSTKYAIFELGIDHLGEMESYLEVVKPTIGIITGISPVHADSEHLGSVKNIIKEKRKLIESLPPIGYAILNYDDDTIRNMATHTKARVIFYGNDKKAEVWGDTVSVSLDGTHFTLHDEKNTFEINTPLIGKHHIYTIMATYIVNRILGEPIKTFLETVSSVKPLHRRMSLEKGPMGTLLLDDSLRANPASTASGLATFAEIPYSNGKKIAILGEMGELGDYAIDKHKEIGKLLATLEIDWFVGIGPLQKYAVEEAVKSGFAKDHAVWTENVFEAVDRLKKIIKKDDFLYLKGSVLRHVERVLLLLENHEVGCTVNNCPFYHHCLKCPYLKTGYQNFLPHT